MFWSIDKIVLLELKNIYYFIVFILYRFVKMSSLYNYKIPTQGANSDMDQKHVNLKLKKNMIDEVGDMNRKMRLRHASVPEDNFSASVPNQRLINTGRPSKETMVSRKNLMFESLVE